MIRFLLIVGAWLSCITSLFSQDNSLSSFKIYVNETRYNNHTQAYFARFPNFDNYSMITLGHVCPPGTDIVDFERLRKRVVSLFPNEEDEGLVNINIENNWFENLKRFSVEDQEYKGAASKFISIIKYIKKIRPQAKVGIYGIPFRFNFNNQRTANLGNKFLDILSHCDYISPSLYISYPEKQRGRLWNLNFFKANLDVSFKLGRDLKKPVIPFFWYMINPYNKKYGYEVLEKETVHRYIRFLKQYSSYGQNVHGIIWWDPSAPSFQKAIENSIKGERRQHTYRLRDELLQYYSLHTIF